MMSSSIVAPALKTGSEDVGTNGIRPQDEPTPRGRLENKRKKPGQLQYNHENHFTRNMVEFSSGEIVPKEQKSI